MKSLDLRQSPISCRTSFLENTGPCAGFTSLTIVLISVEGHQIFLCTRLTHVSLFGDRAFLLWRSFIMFSGTCLLASVLIVVRIHSHQWGVFHPSDKGLLGLQTPCNMCIRHQYSPWQNHTYIIKWVMAELALETECYIYSLQLNILINLHWISQTSHKSVMKEKVTQLCPTLCNPMDYSIPDFPVHHQLLELAQTHLHWVGNPIQSSHPLSSPLLLSSIFPSIRWPKYWSFSFSISPSNGYSGLNSFRIDWLALLAVQGTLKRLLQHYSSKASIHQHSAFFIVQLSHPYMTTGKTIALTRWTFDGKVMSLLFNTA